MHFALTLLTLALSTLLTPILAKPVNLTPAVTDSSLLDVGKRITNENICVVLCKDTEFKNCSEAPACAMAGKCVGLGTDFAEQISSMIIEYGHECTLWASIRCDGDRSGHIPFDKAAVLPGWDNRMNSYSCWKQPEDPTK